MVFLMIPALIYTGKLVPFDELSPSEKNRREIPLLAEVSPGRWAYEALVVMQYSRNPYNKRFFDSDRKAYYHSYLTGHVVPALETYLSAALQHYENRQQDSLSMYLNVLSEEILQIGQAEYIAPFENLRALRNGEFNRRLHDEVFGYLTYLKFLSESIVSEMESAVELQLESLSDSLGKEGLEVFRKRHHNREIILTNPARPEYAELIVGSFIKRGKSVFLDAAPTGKSGFYSSRKELNGETDVLRFNLSILWILSLAFYILFLTEAFKAPAAWFSVGRK
jgi:hypothetical protein